MVTTTNEALQRSWSEVRLIAAIRWMLATTALTIIYLDPKEPDNHTPGLTYAVLGAYVLYSTVLYVLAIRRSPLQSRFECLAHWIDVAWFTVLIGMSSGTNRVFFFGFLFAILVASFSRGFKAGMSVVMVSTLAITVVGYTTETASPGFEGYGFDVYRFMLRPTFLLLLGYLMAHWGESEIESKRRLALLKDIALSNPRFGVDRTINALLEKLRGFYDADLGLLLTVDPRSRRQMIYRSERGSKSARPEEVAPGLLSELLDLPESVAVWYSRKRWPLRKSMRDLQAFDVLSGERYDQLREQCERIADKLDALSLISVPTYRHREFSGRLYFTTSRRRSLRTTDLLFLSQVVEQAGPIIENIRLVDTLASDAAEHERRRIARDLHDSIIQPYIGFQIALSGLRRRINSGQVDLDAEIEQLAKMTAVGVSDLRSYVNNLKTPGASLSSLLPAVARFTRTFSEATGINVRIENSGEMPLNDALASEAFQMIAEGLSNIRRHTEATNAIIGISCDDHRLVLRIENDGDKDIDYEPFTPKSITERAASLGGSASVERRGENSTIVHVEVPL